jgi:chemotaxis protein methyltransferase CheR
MTLSQDQFNALSTLLKAETAVVLEPGKEYLVESRLSKLIREEGFNDLSALLNKVLLRSDPELNKKVLMALTTNETSFFRDLAPFEFLKKHAIPELMKKRASTKKLTLWSAACSTGQEPYSLAILLRDSFPELNTWQISVLASDLNPSVVSKAAQGTYSSLEVNRGLPIQLLLKYFTQKNDSFLISTDLQKIVSFFDLNLLSPWPKEKVDVLFLRNVLIYFDVETKKAIFEKVKKTLASDGYLFLGTAETPFRIAEGFARVEGVNNVFRLENAY